MRATRFFTWAIVALLALTLLYALSFGPAVMLAQRRSVSTETVEKLYSPLETLALIVPGTDWLLKHYVELWAAPEPPP